MMSNGYTDPLDNKSHRDNILGYHPANPATASKHDAIRQAAMEFADVLFRNVPQCPERTLSFRNIQLAMMYGNAGIAINGGDPVPEDGSRVINEMGKPGLKE